MVNWLNGLGISFSGDYAYIAYALSSAIIVIMVSTIVSAMWSVVVGIFTKH